MLLWFAGASVVIVWFVFRSPALDYRLVVVGSILPLGEVVFGGPRLAHTLLFSVVALGAIMLLTRHRRLLRRRWISLAIGLLLHLVLDGIWAEADVFWWPFFGTGFDVVGLPELGRPLAVALVLEAAGVAALVWAYRTFGLDEPAARGRFLRTGQLPRVPEAA